MHQQPPIRFVHPDRSNRRGHKNRKHCNREHKLSARQTETQRNRPDRRLYGCFRQIGDHTEQPLFFIQLRPCHTQEHACCTKQERNPDHQKCIRTSACCIPDIDRRADQHKQHDFRCQPELAELFRQALRNLRHTFCLQHARHAHNRQKPGYRNDSFQPRFHCHQKKRQTEHQDHLHAVSDTAGTGVCRFKNPCQHITCSGSQHNAEPDRNRNLHKVRRLCASSLRHAHKCREQNDDENIVAGCTRHNHLRDALLRPITVFHQLHHPRNHDCRGNRPKHCTHHGSLHARNSKHIRSK